MRPQDVTSPRDHWTLADVLLEDGGEDDALAVGYWDGEPVLAMRHNNGLNNDIGSPQSRGLPTWFIVPHHYEDAILGTLPQNKRHYAEIILKKGK